MTSALRHTNANGSHVERAEIVEEAIQDALEALEEAVSDWTSGPADGPEAGEAHLRVLAALADAREARATEAQVCAAIRGGCDEGSADLGAVLSHLRVAP